MAYSGALMRNRPIGYPWVHLSITVAGLLLANCSSPRMPAATPARAVFYTKTETRLFAGVERTDITPPPGIATFGHGPDARVAAGYWTRLECRAFVFLTEANNAPTALVPCDLAAVSTLLQRTVVARLRQDGVEIPPQQLFISAIHTHAGPAHYFDASFYGDTASTQGPGFDPRVLDYLANKIAAALRSAYRKAKEAKTKGRPALIRWAHGESWGLTHNRSLEAFARNKPLMPTGTPPDDLDGKLDPASKAIDPKMDVLEIEEEENGTRLPLGWIGFFAMHPTVLSHNNRHLGGDVYGVASRLLEQELRRQASEKGYPECKPVVGFINTNEGDMSPRWSTGDRGEVIAFGRRVAEEMLRIHKETLDKNTDAKNTDAKPCKERVADAKNTDAKPYKDRVAFASSYIEVRLPNNRFGLERGKLCERAALGENALWGAQDHLTFLAAVREPVSAPRTESLLPASAREKDINCQSPKREALGFLQEIVAGEGSFPVTIPLSLLLIDDTWVAFVPAELTITAGWRIRDTLTKLRQRTADGRQVEARIGGLTNGYMEYVATEEEYQLQRYEGASTLYGPKTSRFLTSVFKGMAERMLSRGGESPEGSTPEVASDFQYETGPERHRLADSIAEPVAVKSIELCRLKPQYKEAPDRFCFVWEDGAPNLYSSPPRRPVELAYEKGVKPVQPRLPARVQLSPKLQLAAASTGDPELSYQDYILRDDGFEFLTTVHGRSLNGWIWSTLFEPTREEWQWLQKAPEQFVFKVGNSLALPVVQSKPFTFVSNRVSVPECSISRVQFCEGAE
jgi:neutral ceramidase